MHLPHFLVRLLIRRLSPQEALRLAGEILPEMMDRFPQGDRVTLLKDMAEGITRIALRDLGRKERSQLMNALLPLLVQEFPVAELDFMTAFPDPAVDGATAGD
jgi:hypothetical protein